MERLTTRDNGHPALARGYEERFTEPSLFFMLLNRLAAYEDTGLGPEEIVGADNMLKENWDIPLSRLKEAIELIKAKDEKWLKVLPPNDPLTLEELREMGGEPYWHVGLQEDSPPPHWNILDPFYARHIEGYGYGKRWLAYRRKPEEGTPSWNC